MKKFIFGLFVVLFIWWFNTFTIKVNHVSIEDSRINSDIVICQISDLHGFKFGIDNQRLIKEIKNQNPDIILSTGDMFTYNDSKGEDTALQLLTDLTKVAPVYYVNGEHDNDEAFFNHLMDNGVHVFNYEQEIIKIKDTELHLYGTNNMFYTETFDLHHEWVDDDQYFSILMSHLSNFDAFSEFGIDLTLSGDTHGGQVRLPFIGAIYAEDAWFPDLNGNYVKGLYQKDNHYLYVSSGLGSNPIPLRFLNRPEVAVIHLKNKTK